MSNLIIKAVIGANYGDEGKGLVTNYFCKQFADNNQRCAVICTNGGAQRGHTVCTPSGLRHVFHHFGSGTFSGADTFFSPNFIINPMQFAKEYKELKALGFEPKSYFMSYCNSITTPFDMILNQIVEEQRGKNKHGSTGMGIWETIVRNRMNFEPLILEHIINSNSVDLKQKLYNIRDNYLLKKIDIDTISDEWKEIIYSDELINNFLLDIDFLKNHIESSVVVCFPYDAVVLENGQGLLLDQNIDEIYSTPSNTGIKDIVAHIMRFSLLMDIQPDIEICYVTRTYLTRHGAGPFPEECQEFAKKYNIFDKTNVYNPYQGNIRYGLLNNKELVDRVVQDFNSENFYGGAKISLAVTHTNEYDEITDDSCLNIFNNVYVSNNEYDLKKFNLKK